MRSVLLLSLTAALGCRNPCQQLCTDIRDYAEDECGLQFTNDEVKACIADHKRSEVDRGTRQTCDQGLETLQNEWTCEDLQDYFTDAPAGDSGL